MYYFLHATNLLGVILIWSRSCSTLSEAMSKISQVKSIKNVLKSHNVKIASDVSEEWLSFARIKVISYIFYLQWVCLMWFSFEVAPYRSPFCGEVNTLENKKREIFQNNISIPFKLWESPNKSSYVKHVYKVTAKSIELK